MPFPIGIDQAAEAGPLPVTMAQWGLNGTPSVVLFDRQGRARLHRFGVVDDLVLGAEYRMKPNNLEAGGAALREDDWKDLFIAWAPSKNVSLTLAWVDLGRIVPGVTRDKRQTGYYLSAQVAF